MSESGTLRLKGRHLPISRHELNLVARRLTNYHSTVKTELIFEPESYRHRAGLAAFYDTQHFYWLTVSHDDSIGKCVALMGHEQGKYREIAQVDVADEAGAVKRHCQVNQEQLQFSDPMPSKKWEQIAAPQYFGNPADKQQGHSGFTGAMVAALLGSDMLHESRWATLG